MTSSHAYRADGLRAVSLPVGLGGGALLVSAYLAHGDPGSAIAPVGIIAGVLAASAVVPRRWRWGVLIAILIITSIDALPGPDLTTRKVALGLDMQDVVVFGLMAVLFADVLAHRLWRFYGTPLGRLLLLASLTNLAWWVFTLLRTSTIQGIVLTHAISFVWGFIFNIALVPLLAASFQRRDTRNAVLVTVGLLGLIPACFFIVGSVTHSSFSAILHANTTRTVGGLNRLFAPAHDLFLAAFPVGAAAALLLPAGKWRRIAVLIAAINLLAIVAGQTRAQYLGTTVGFLVASALYLRGPDGLRAARRIAVALALLAALVVVLLVSVPHAAPSKAIRSFGSRIVSISDTVSSSNTTTSTVAVRTGEINLLKQRLGSRWLLGLGFIDPRDIYDADLPFGSIRNTDVGISSPILTMGVIGTALYYLSILAVTLCLLWRSRRRHGRDTWLRYGTLAGLIGVLVSSTTLTTFFSDTGVVAVAGLIALGAAAASGQTGVVESPSDRSTAVNGNRGSRREAPERVAEATRVPA